MSKRRIFLALSFTAWIASSSFADPQTLISASSAANTTSLDQYVSQMWTTQQQLVDSLASHGLIDATEQHDHYFDHGAGVGGEYGGELSILSQDHNDGIQQQIDQISRQAQTRQENLDRLTESLTVTRSYRNSNDPSPYSVNVSNSILAIEPIANARVSSTFGYRHLFGKTAYHSGIDLAAPTGTPIYATGDGVVTHSGWGRGYGNYVEIDHGNGYVTRYGHASRLYVSVGDQVKANQNIAAVGCTGRCTGPHLHYEVLKDGKRENPATYLALAPKREF
ncbi:M23 family metallopeptidase [Alkanindiges sp. WGS2144]|uniref:M23 family metallopeptidase n=1 Tax=Alkanindiges sp. WGS2144 TaxID=3366808 RepID=UPI0037514F56